MRTLLVLIFLLMTTTVDAQPINATMTPTFATVPTGNSQTFLLQDTNIRDCNLSYFVLGSIKVVPRARLFGRYLGIGLDEFTIATLAYANTQYFNKFQGSLNCFGQAAPTFMVPNESYLRGYLFYFVGITWDPKRTNRMHVSNVVAVRVR